jgi:hypothetical protein
MYAPGKILRVGGGGLNNQATADGRNAAAVIDINGPTPQIALTASMPAALHWHTATVVADGRVVVTGGSLKSNQLVGVSAHALIWDPATNKWTRGAKGSGRSRLYHSTALLLPDATVLVGGGGARGPQTNLNVEKYFPPYLYTAAGAFAPRLNVLTAPAKLTHGKQFKVTLNKAWRARRVTLIKTGSVTHSFNMEQRFMELSFVRSGNQLLVKAPANLNLATPGKYLLFVLNAQGVPSMARIVSVANAANPPVLQPFDGLEYIASYPDLIAAFGANAAAGTQHYVAMGQSEGRVPSSFNAHQYLANYPDLQAAFGTNLTAARVHYITFGYFEGRTDKAPPTGY